MPLRGALWDIQAFGQQSGNAAFAGILEERDQARADLCERLMGQRFFIPVEWTGKSAQDDILQILLHKPGDAPRSISRIYIVGEIARVLHILHFTDLSNIQPVYYDKTYHAIPEQGGEKAYELLRKAMKEENKIAIAKTVLGTKEKLLALKFMTRTANGGMRQPVFKGLREDKRPEECIDTSKGRAGN